jgi:hypothetical protein
LEILQEIVEAIRLVADIACPFVECSSGPSVPDEQGSIKVPSRTSAPYVPKKVSRTRSTNHFSRIEQQPLIIQSLD